MNVALAVLAAASAPAQPIAPTPIAPTATAPADVTFYKTRDLKLNVSLHPDRSKEVAQLLLFVSSDGGGMYDVRARLDPAKENEFRYTVKEDGEYWVRMQTMFKNGTLEPKDPSRLPPEQKLVVDTVRPVVAVTQAEAVGDEVAVAWTITDKHPVDASTRVWYKPTGGDNTQWQQVPAANIVKRTARFKPTVGGPLTVQVGTLDLAGNDGFASKEVAAKGAITPVAGAVPLPPSTVGEKEPVAPVAPPPLGPVKEKEPFNPSGPLPAPFEPEPARTPTTPAPPPDSQRLIATSSGPPPAAAAPPPAATPPAEAATAQYSRSPRFELNYTLDSGASGVARVDLYVTRDDGRSWVRWSQHDGRETPLKVVLDTKFNKEVEGDYGLALVPVSGAGLSDGAPAANTAPEMKVRVDTTAPVIKVFAPTADPNNKAALVLNWEATDKNFGRDPIAIEYAEAPQGPWKSVTGTDGAAARVENSGQYSWQPPVNLATPKVYLRFAAWDLAGNKSEVTTPNPILVDLTKPKARIQGISLTTGPLRTIPLVPPRREGRMKRRLLAIVGGLGAVAAVAAVGFFGCRSTPPDPPPPPALFDDLTAASGPDFTYRNGDDFTPQLLTILESLGGGGAALDFDGDGLLDLLFAGGGQFTGPGGKTITGLPCKLFRNRGGFQFEATDALPEPAGGWFYSHGVAVADYDRDGWPDVLLTGWERVALFRNVAGESGGRKFTDVTAAVGLNRGVTWATSAAFGDLDGDGFPDLYVCQYADWSFANHPRCSYDGKTPDVCAPTQFNGLPHLLFRNVDGKRFENVGDAAGLKPGGAKASYGLGVLMADLDGDGKPDVFVANDSAPKFLYLNQSKPGAISLSEQAMPAGVAMDAGGRPNGSMGVDAGDPEGTGRPALWVTNFENEMHAVYRNQSKAGRPRFEFASDSLGVAALSKKFVGWGGGFVDVDLDGWEDVVIAHGHAFRHPKGAPRRQQPVLLLNSAGKFSEQSARGGVYFQQPHSGRGAVLADLDNDGRVDVAVSHVNEPVTLLRNVAPPEHHWVGVELRGRDHADVTGAKVELVAGGRTQTRFAKGGGSYASSGDRRLVFGLGGEERVEKLTVHWPGGSKQEWTDVPADRYWRATTGEANLGSPAGVR